ncbi:MAG TPA: FHA domain-containing protein [Thermoanaerobaculia bacterium]|nr:FHA domain-containing protein [Thermoanaerobaculia bacterium]
MELIFAIVGRVGAPEATSLIIECAHCHTRYQYDEERFERKRSKKIRCAKCKEIFEIMNPAFDEPAPIKANPSDDTVVRRKRTSAGDEPIASPLSAVEEPGPGDAGDGDAPLKLPADRRLSLAITDGPDEAKVFRIDKPRVVIGRANTDIALNDPEASREHAAIEVHENEFFLRDLDSRNGTFLDANRLETEPVEIFNQTEFRVGSTTLMLIVTEID